MTTEFATFPASILLLLLILLFPLILLFVVSRLARKVKVGPQFDGNAMPGNGDHEHEKER